MTVVIDDVVTSYSYKLDSHRSSWTRVLARAAFPLFGQVRIAFDDYFAAMQADTWLVAHPMEFNGETYNLFGGWNESVRDRVARLLYFEGQLCSLQKRMPNLRELLEPRAAKTDYNFTDIEWDKIEQQCLSASITDAFPYTSSMIVGDSHSIAVYEPGFRVHRRDGQTLKGLIKEDWMRRNAHGDTLIVCAGNIDIRHHFGRDDTEIKQFASRRLFDLKVQLQDLQKRGRIYKYKIVDPYPIEHEGRRVPKTGYFKGTPFFMPREARAELVSLWRSLARDLFEDEQIIDWPEEWYKMDPEQYAREHMEKPGSVHLSPRWHKWDYLNNMPNYKARVSW